MRKMSRYNRYSVSFRDWEGDSTLLKEPTAIGWKKVKNGVGIGCIRRWHGENRRKSCIDKIIGIEARRTGLQSIRDTQSGRQKGGEGRSHQFHDLRASEGTYTVMANVMGKLAQKPKMVLWMGLSKKRLCASSWKERKSEWLIVPPTVYAMRKITHHDCSLIT